MTCRVPRKSSLGPVVFLISILTLLIAVGAAAQTTGQAPPLAKSRAGSAQRGLGNADYLSVPPFHRGRFAANSVDTDNPLFLPVVTYDSGSAGRWGTSSVVVGDVNADGRPDLVVANGFPNNVAVLLGNGDGTFQTAVIYGTGAAYATSIALADMNGDGNPDIVLGERSLVAVLLGKGDGTFRSAVTYNNGGVLANSIAVADLNGDGKVDVVVEGCVSVGGDQSNDEIAVLLGNGDGTFRPPAIFDPGGGEFVLGSIELGAKSVAIADANNDGKPDLLVANLMGCSSCHYGTVGVLIGNGDGTFQSPVAYFSGGSDAFSVQAADFDADGRTDLVVANNYGGIGVLLGNGDATFQPALTYSSGGSYPTSVEVADMNGDNKPDLLVANDSNSATGFGLLLGNGDGTFLPVTTYDPGAVQAVSVEAADFTGDGMSDVVVSSAVGVLGVLLHVGDTPATVKLISAPMPSVFGQSVSFTARVRSSSGTPNGVVDFLEGSTVLGSASLTNGTASLPVSSLQAGSHSIVARYRGSLKFKPVTSNPVNQVVSVAATTTSLTASHNPGVLNQRITYTATVTSPYGGVATGTLTFQDGGSPIASATLTSNRGVCTMSYKTIGSRSITTVYAGDANLTGSISPILSEQIKGFPSKTTLTTSGSPSLINQMVSFTASVTSAYGTIPAGELVTLYDGATILGSVALLGGRATYTTSSLSAKTHSIKATYSGDATFTQSTGVIAQVVYKYPTATALQSSSNPSGYGQPVTLTATVTGPGPNPTGQVWFKDGATGLGLVPLNAGVATLTKPKFAVGSHPITAQYRGDSNSASSTSVIWNQVVQ